MKFISKAIDVVNKERPIFAIVLFFVTVFDRIRGRFFAAIIGWSGSYIGVGAKIIGTKAIRVGYGAYINRYAWIEAVHNFQGYTFFPNIWIGNWFSASDRLHISCINEVRIGDCCLFGSGVYIADHNHGIYSGKNQSDPAGSPISRQLLATGAVVIGSNVWLGDNVVIVGPVTIGDGVVIGANSVVTRDIPENVIAVGAPARIVKKYESSSGEWRTYADAK
ncbi:MAG: acyltransferase [Azonexaceae bacterium]|nr:acyltransferase [Azonexaceae bacterium]